MSLRSRRLDRSRAFDTAIAPLLEQLEPRRMLAINPVGTPLTGALTGKIVYTSGGHGWQWNDTLNRYATDRGDNNEIVEDFGNQDQLTFYADYLLRAGATVVPMRPIGRQTSEVVVDNDMTAAVTYTGAWSDSAGSRYYDEDYDVIDDPVHYRFANTTTGAETATATYTPNIPQAGFYPVYTWAAHGANRTSQLYEINHTGGQAQVRVDHSLVGNGWVYLGTYHFNSGSSAAAGSVQISNQGTASKVVIADAIRFGNGMGDVKSGVNGIGHSSGVVSGYPREDENSLHWLWRGIGLGVTPSTVLSTSNVSAPSNMAQHMNLAPFGTSVYIGFHSNAGGGRGARGLIDSDQGTLHQGDLALYTGRQINQDMQALNGQFEHNWSTGTTHTFSSGFGEIDLGVGAEMDATIIEVAFHDSVEDAALMRDPKVRDQLARSTYEATLEYFDNWGGLTAPVAVPSAPINVRAVSNASGQVTLDWATGPTGVRGGTATGYRIYTSLNGYGFDGGTTVAGGATTTATITGLDPNVPHYFKIVATNAGGESHESEVMAALPSGGAKRVLIVSGFDRFDRGGNVRYPYAHVADGLTDRVFPRLNNSFDYPVQVATAIDAAKRGTHFASTSNEAVISGAVNLADYHTVIWIAGEESTANDTFDATEQTKVEQFIAGGGNLFVTGSEIGWDLDQQNNGRTFYETTLKGNYVADDAGTYNAIGANGSIFAGLSVAFDNGSQIYNVDFPDIIAPQVGALAALNYSGGAGGTAGIQFAGTGGRGSLVMFGFPFETITSPLQRMSIMRNVLTYLGTSSTTPGTPDLAVASDSGWDTVDNYTNFDNSTPANALQFSVADTVAGATIDIYAGNTLIGSTIATGGTMNVTSDGVTALSGGVHNITVWQTEVGKPGAPSAFLPITLDLVAPAASTLPDLAAASDTGPSTTDNYTNDSTPTFGLVAEIDTRPTMVVNGADRASTFTNPGGGTTYNVTITPALAHGGYTVAARMVDRAGNVGALSTAASVTIDTQAPAAPAAPDLAAASDSGASNSDDVTNVVKPTFTGFAEPNSTVTIRSDTAAVATGTAAAGDGSYTATLTTSSLAAGVRSITAIATDLAGNASAAGAALAVTVDLTAIASVPDLTAASDSGSSSTDNRTNVTTPTVTGTAEAGATLAFQIDGVAAGSDNDGDGLYSFTAPAALADGSHTFRVVVTDVAGNTATTANLGVIIDTTPPTATLGSQTPTNGAATFDFTVTYTEANGFSTDIGTFGDDDITVVGPDDTLYAATMVDPGVGGGLSRIVTYRIAAPGGTWEGADDGTYTVAQNASSVADVAGNFRPAGSIGTFSFAAPFAYLVGNDLHVDYLASGNVVALLANGGNLDVTQGATTLTFASASFDSVILHGTSGADTLNFTGPVAQPITFDGGAGDDQLNVLGGTFTFAGDAAADCDALAVHVAGGAAAVFDATQHLRDLDVAADGIATLTQGGAKVLVTNGLAVAGRLNLTDNDLVLDYAPGDANPVAAVQALVVSAYNFGSWDGPGITTDTADSLLSLTTLGVGDPSAVFGIGATDTVEFSGQTIDATSVVIKYTYAGDANLDGQIDAGDYGILDFFIQSEGATGYFNGDYNYDGFIDAGDYGTIDNNIQYQGVPL